MSEDMAPSSSTVTFKRRGGGNRRQRATREADSDDGEDAVIKKQAKQLKGAIRISTKTEGVDKSLEAVYAGSGQIRDQGDMGATRMLEEETERDRDRRAQKEAFMNDRDQEEGKYKGMSGYKDWKQVW
jgi:hypothetical protein